MCQKLSNLQKIWSMYQETTVSKLLNLQTLCTLFPFIINALSALQSRIIGIWYFSAQPGYYNSARPTVIFAIPLACPVPLDNYITDFVFTINFVLHSTGCSTCFNLLGTDKTNWNTLCIYDYSVMLDWPYVLIM